MKRTKQHDYKIGKIMGCIFLEDKEPCKAGRLYTAKVRGLLPNSVVQNNVCKGEAYSWYIKHVLAAIIIRSKVWHTENNHRARNWVFQIVGIEEVTN